MSNESTLKLIERYRKKFNGGMPFLGTAHDTSSQPPSILEGEIVYVPENQFLFRHMTNGRDCYLRWKREGEESRLVEMTWYLMGIPIVQKFKDSKHCHLFMGRNRI